MKYSEMTEKELLDKLIEYRDYKPRECKLIVFELRKRRENDKKRKSP